MTDDLGREIAELLGRHVQQPTPQHYLVPAEEFEQLLSLQDALLPTCEEPQGAGARAVLKRVVASAQPVFGGDTDTFGLLDSTGSQDERVCPPDYCYAKLGKPPRYQTRKPATPSAYAVALAELLEAARDKARTFPDQQGINAAAADLLSGVIVHLRESRSDGLATCQNMSEHALNWSSQPFSPHRQAGMIMAWCMEQLQAPVPNLKLGVGHA